MVLGSGLRELAGELELEGELSFGEIPRWPAPAVQGHGAKLVWGRIRGLNVACMQGRVHLYEGHSPAEVVRSLRSLRVLGAERFLLTNAAGGLAAGMQAGDLMLIEDQINLTGASPLLGPVEEDLGPRFPDQSHLYDPGMRAAMQELAPEISSGVYAGMLGPGYETPAEIRMLQGMGASAVGMSTVLEVMALAAMGARVLGVSLISNLAAGLAEKPLSHSEVLAAGRSGSSRMNELIRGLCRKLAKHG
jgi:purine-nucleoside phosphorylase